MILPLIAALILQLGLAAPKAGITVTADGRPAAGASHIKVFDGATGAELSPAPVRPRTRR